jgi:8-oxo-dGTP pyrophosphatase MutT (NUDIX family)
LLLQNKYKEQVAIMTVQTIKQLPLTFGPTEKSDVRSQFAALCYRYQKDKLRVMLITSRDTGRWIIPKGWPMDGKTPAQSALQEAWEEAGVLGKCEDRCLGLFAYRKFRDDTDDLPCVAMVFPVRVKDLKDVYPEAGQRQRKWVSRARAAKMVAEPELARILSDFDPKLLG